MRGYSTNTTENYEENLSSTNVVLKIENEKNNFNQNSKTVDCLRYSVTNSDKYPSFIQSFKSNLKDFELVNEKEIIEFIFHNYGLLELIKEVTSIIKENFPNEDLALEFNRDPEIPSFNKIILYVKCSPESFDKNWEDIKKINKNIGNLYLYDDSVKDLFSVDLW